MYHVNNPEEIKTGAKPNITEIGPFVYKEYRERRNITFSEDGCSVKASTWKKYEFDQAKTTELCGDTCSDGKDTNITTINTIYVDSINANRDQYSRCLF